jgi:hypothetical protein
MIGGLFRGVKLTAGGARRAPTIAGEAAAAAGIVQRTVHYLLVGHDCFPCSRARGGDRAIRRRGWPPADFTPAWRQDFGDEGKGHTGAALGLAFRPGW